MITVLKRFLLMSRLIILFTIIVSLVKCANNKPSLIKQKISDKPVIIRYNKKYNKITRIKIPISIELKSNSNYIKKYFVEIRYLYNKNEGITENLYKEVKGGGLIKIKNNQKRLITENKDNKYILYSSHKVDSSRVIQKKIKKYIREFLAKNQDTLHIGTVSVFKEKYEELFNKLTKNDSISIQFLDNDKFSERVVIPVKWN